jgi:hypothetical protein
VWGVEANNIVCESIDINMVVIYFNGSGSIIVMKLNMKKD